MEHAIKSRYNDTILNTACHRYGIAPDAITLLDGFESFIYAFTRDGGAYILRIGHSIRRTPEQIRGEVEWINHLAAGGAGVAKAIDSLSGRLVEAIDDGHGGQFLVTAFDKAPGKPIWEVGWSPSLYETYGHLLGRIHTLTKHYTPSDPAIRRWNWNDPVNMDVLRWLPEKESTANAKFQQTLAQLEALPYDAETYGLIHQDAHSGNFFVDDTGQITLFDFDDCVYGPFIYDIAMVIFYMAINHADPVKLMAEFWPRFWNGYCAENTLDPVQLQQIPLWLKLREIDLYALHYRSFGDPENADDPWSVRYLKGRKARIDGDVPVVDFAFG